MREQAISGAVLGVQADTAGRCDRLVPLGRDVTFARQLPELRGARRAHCDDFLRGAKNTLTLAFRGSLVGSLSVCSSLCLRFRRRRVVRAPAGRVHQLLPRNAFDLATVVLLLPDHPRIRPETLRPSRRVIVFGLNTGAYAAEVFRAGIQSIERGQIEAARSLGMTYMQSMRYAIVPQAVRRVIPPLMNEFVILIKDTSLIAVLGLTCVGARHLFVLREGYSSTGNATFFVATAAGYLVVTLPLIRLVNAVEHRCEAGYWGWRTDERRRLTRQAGRVHKWFGKNHVLRGIDSSINPARRGDHRAIGFRQVDDAAHDQHAGGAELGKGVVRTAGDHGHPDRREQGAHRYRHRVPSVQPVPA